MANFFGSILNAARQTFAGDVMQSAGKFDVVEIPANHLRTNDPYVRSLDDKLAGAAADLVYILKNGKSGQFHVVVRYQVGQAAKVFSIYRDTDATAAVDVAELFRKQSELILLSKTEETLKLLIQCMHSHPAWDTVHLAAAVGLTAFFSSLPAGGGTVALINSKTPLTGTVPLHIAVEHGRLEIVQSLLSLGADVKAVDSNGMNAFHYAATVNGTVIQILSKHLGASAAINRASSAGRTPLYIAAVVGKPDCVSALLKAGAVGTVRCENRTVLEAALHSPSAKKAECVEIIARAFPALIVEPGAAGSTPLHYCDDRKVLRTLVQAAGTNAAVFDVRDTFGETPLHCAIRRADLAAVVSFVAHGADLDARNPDGQTSLHLSLSLVKDAGQLSILKALLVLGASCSIADAEGRLPRHVACGSQMPLRKEVMTFFEMIDAERCSSEQKGCVDACRFVGGSKKSSGPTTNEGLHELRQRWCISHTKEKKQKGQSRLLNLLALDGGGVRGLVLIQILLALEKVLGANRILERMDWMSATSTGAIVAAAFCQGRSLREIQRLYFRLKDVVFDSPIRPYDSLILEQFLKQELSARATIGDIVKPKLIVTTAQADINPIKLKLIRNYQLPLSAKENEAHGYDDPKNWPLWKAVRCSSAAPTYFSSVDNRYVDGGLIANNPTLDLLTEVTNYEFAAKLLRDGDNKAPTEIGCVISVGCGEMPATPVKCSMDLAKPVGIVDALGAVFAVKNLGDILINQVTATGGRPVDRSRAWCHMMNIPFFRFSPTLFKDVALDTVDDTTLIQMLWCTVEYLHENRAELETVGELLC